MTDLIATIYDTLPGHRTTADQLDQVNSEIKRRAAQARANTPGTGYRYVSVSRAVLEEMLAAGDPLEDLAVRIAARESEQQAAGLAAEALKAMSSQLTSQLTGIRNNPCVLSALNDALAELLDDITTLEPLAEIATESAAFTSKRFDDAQRLAELLTVIGTLRHEQLRILRATGHVEWSSKVSIAACIRNVESVYADWAIWLQYGVLWNRRSEEQRQLNPPWPWPLGSAMATPEFSLWALQAGARLWIPTPDEYDIYAEDLRTRCKEPRTDERTDDWRDPATFSNKGRALIGR